MSWLPVWFRRPHRTHKRASQRLATPEQLPLIEDEAPPKGCGWFDSSHELMRGLVVVEFELVPSPWSGA